MTTMRDRGGHEIDFLHWFVLAADNDYQNVAKTYVGRVGHVSTIWTGVDHGDGLIFETMIFPQHPAMLELQWRYRTEREARDGHYKATVYLRVYLGREGER